MALRQTKPPILQPAREPQPAPAAEPVAQEPATVTQRVTGVGERGIEQNVPFVIDGAGRKIIAAPHPLAGNPW